MFLVKQICLYRQKVALVRSKYMNTYNLKEARLNDVPLGKQCKSKSKKQYHVIV